MMKHGSERASNLSKVTQSDGKRAKSRVDDSWPLMQHVPHRVYFGQACSCSACSQTQAAPGCGEQRSCFISAMKAQLMPSGRGQVRCSLNLESSISGTSLNLSVESLASSLAMLHRVKPQTFWEPLKCSQTYLAENEGIWKSRESNQLWNAAYFHA